jgi:hypothetical protein
MAMLSRASSLVYGRARRLTDQAAQRDGEHARDGPDLVRRGIVTPSVGKRQNRLTFIVVA